MNPRSQVTNFGGNVQFRPKQLFAPTTEVELLEILNTHRDGCIRVIGAQHSWSDVCRTDDTLIDMGHFQQIRITEKDGQVLAVVGAGCRIRTLLKALNARQLTLPSVGLITEQTIAGATATGTHGSGKHSLSHYVVSMKIACFTDDGQTAQTVTICDGIELRAARCSLGCLGIVMEITVPCIPQYRVQEQTQPRNTIEEILELERTAPLQQFFLFPHAWTYFAQTRRVAEKTGRSHSAWLYRIYWFLSLDVGLHLLIKLFVSVLRSRSMVRFLFRRLLPNFIFPRWVVADRSDRQLTMEHELFRHLELEAFVRRPQLIDASRLVMEVLRIADSPEYEPSRELLKQLETVNMSDRLNSIAGCFTHHYPVCFRRILPDDTLISMASGTDEDWYSISFITYQHDRDDFYRLAEFLAESISLLFRGRIHWGKWFPLNADHVARQYPDLEQFRRVARRFDPLGVFANSFVREKLRLHDSRGVAQ